MPTVLRVGGYRFFFVSLDRSEPPHIHGGVKTKSQSFSLILSFSSVLEVSAASK
jgi:hypothetical protein